MDPQSSPSRRQEMSAAHREMLDKRIAELKSRIGKGGLREAAIRGLLYIGSARGMVDERSLEALRSLRRSDTGARLTLAEFKMLVREQFFMLLLDQEASLAAIPKMLPDNADARRTAFAAIHEILSASAEISGEVGKRLKRVAELFAWIPELKEGLECRPLRPEGEGIVALNGDIRSDIMKARQPIEEKRALPANMTI